MYIKESSYNVNGDVIVAKFYWNLDKENLEHIVRYSKNIMNYTKKTGVKVTFDILTKDEYFIEMI